MPNRRQGRRIVRAVRRNRQQQRIRQLERGPELPKRKRLGALTKIRMIGNLIKLANAGRRNVGTTVIGLLAAVALLLKEASVQPDFDLADWKNWLPSLLIAAVGLAAKDANRSGGEGGEPT